MDTHPGTVKKVKFTQPRTLTKFDFYKNVVGIATMLDWAEDILNTRTQQALQFNRSIPKDVSDSVIQWVMEINPKTVHPDAKRRIKLIQSHYENL